MDRKPQFRLATVSNGRTQVIENATDLVWRTLPSRAEASDWVSQADPPAGDNRKVKTR
jgi:hypothetical protein